jgi:RND family efflux transporter MFP subunit
MSWRRIFGIAALLLVAAAGTAFLIRMRVDRSVRADTVAPPAVAVDAVSPARSTLHRVVEVFGSLAPKTATEVKSELLARVRRVQVKEWDAVNAGDVLLELDPTDLMLTVGRDEAGLKMARAQQLQAGVDLNRAKREWARAVRLKEGGLVTGQELDERKSGLESAHARVSLAEAQVGQAESQLAEARHNLTKARICAPIEGVVAHRQVDVGDVVDKGTPLFTIVDNRVLDFTANVSALDLVHVVEGQEVVFSVDGLPGREFRGRVHRVNPLVNSSDRSGRIQAEVENGEGLLKGGLFARGRVVLEEREDVLVLPRNALLRWDIEQGKARVFVVDEGGVARSRRITTGLAVGDRVEVSAGLTDSDRVVVRGGFNLREGDRVREAAPEGRS